MEVTIYNIHNIHDIHEISSFSPEDLGHDSAAPSPGSCDAVHEPSQCQSGLLTKHVNS